MNLNPYKTPESPSDRPQGWLSWTAVLVAGGMLGATAGAVCGCGFALLHVLALGSFARPDGARMLVLQVVTTAIGGSLAGLLWGSILAAVAALVPGEASRRLVAAGAAASGLLGMAAGWCFNWAVAGEWTLLMVAFGGSSGLLGGAWGIKRLTRVLQAK